MTGPAAISEADWQETVLALAAVTGWRSMHVRRSIGTGQHWTTATSCAGWPDLVLWHPRRGGVIFAELKAPAGRLTTRQAELLESLRAAGAQVYVWRPSDWHEVRRVLTHHEPDERAA